MSIPKITERLARLDELIVDLTKPPVTSQLRNQVWLVIQDFEAVAKDVEAVSKNVAAMKEKLDAHFNLIDKRLELQSKSLQQYEDLQAELAQLKKKYGKL